MKKRRSNGDIRRTLVALVVLWIILAAGVALAAGYAFGVPPWNAPDEPAHYNYIRHLATTGQLPELKPGDWDAQLLERLKSSRFPKGEPVDSIAYEGHQPPAFYLLATPVYKATAGLPIEEQVVALRLLSVAISGVTVVLSFLLVRAIFPDDLPLQLAVAGFVAFLPMRSAVAGSISNDALAELVGTLILLSLVRILKEGLLRGSALLLGALLGLALLTKMTVYSYVPMALVAVLFSPKRGRNGAHPRAWLVVIAVAVALLVSGWWFVRNGMVYGMTDIFGLQRHDQVVVGQPRLERLDAATVSYFVNTLFQSFWGQFGWMGILMHSQVYFALKMVSALAALGMLLYLARTMVGKSPLAPHQKGSLLLMGVAVVGVAVQLVVYNLSFIQAQGRYLFPALTPIALFFVLGLRELMAPIHARLLLGLSVVSLASLDLLCLMRYVIPYFR